MREELTDMQRIASACPPAAMPAGMRRRLLAAMEQEEAELQADRELESELQALYTAAPMSPALRRRLAQGAAPAPVYRWRRWHGAAAAVLLLLPVLPLLWWGLRPAPGAGAFCPVVELRRELLPAHGESPAVRCDTFEMLGADKSRLVIKVKNPVVSPLPDDVI